MVIISVIKLYITKAVCNKNFRKSIKPYFSGKGSISSNITLVENDTIITEDKKDSKTVNNFFIINTTKNLKIKPFTNSSNSDINQITGF